MNSLSFCSEVIGWVSGTHCWIAHRSVAILGKTSKKREGCLLAQKEKKSRDRPEEDGSNVSAALQAREPGIVGEKRIGERRGGEGPACDFRVFWMGLSSGGQFYWAWVLPSSFLVCQGQVYGDVQARSPPVSRHCKNLYLQFLSPFLISLFLFSVCLVGMLGCVSRSSWCLLGVRETWETPFFLSVWNESTVLLLGFV